MKQMVFLTAEQENMLFFHSCPFCGDELDGESMQDLNGKFNGLNFCEYCCTFIEWEWFDDFKCYVYVG